MFQIKKWRIIINDVAVWVMIMQVWILNIFTTLNTTDVSITNAGISERIHQVCLRK